MHITVESEPSPSRRIRGGRLLRLSPSAPEKNNEIKRPPGPIPVYEPDHVLTILTYRVSHIILDRF